MIRKLFIISFAVTCVLYIGCNSQKSKHTLVSVRSMKDTVGFAHLDWQVDSVVKRINRTYSKEITKVNTPSGMAWRVAICPHDDYTYASWHYTTLLKNIKAKTIIVFGVAHKAKQFNVADQIVFDSYSHWHGPYKDIKVSAIREELMDNMPKELYQVNDSLQKVEHSVESMLPFVQYYNRDAEIIPILVPVMNSERMSEISKSLASAIALSMANHNLVWGKDVALLITTDAVHYGDEDWGGKNMAPFGVDSIGYKKAVAHEHGIMDSCLVGDIDLDKIQQFINNTVQPNNYKEYKWTWCGRYSVPLGLMTALDLQGEVGGEPLKGEYIGYSTSIDHKPLPVEDLRMGKTAIATIRHWVGYASVGFR